MNNRLIVRIGLVVFCVLAHCAVAASAVDPVDAVLKQLNEKAASVKSYQCKIEYVFSQPLFESKTLRKGRLYYRKDKEGSALRINFRTLRQDDEPQQKYIEQYIFDGVWLTVVDYQLKEVKRYQQAEVNEPVDAFELVKRNFPMVGFSEGEDLKKDFEIQLVDLHGSEGGKYSHHLHLKTKADSMYKDDYTSIDFWVDKKSGLSGKIMAVSTEDDVYRINLPGAVVNKKINKKVFKVAIPKGFNESEVVPLHKSKSGSDGVVMGNNK